LPSKALPTAAILPVKRFDGAKQRLASALSGGFRKALAAAMLADVLAALGRSARVEVVLIVSGEPAVRDLAQERSAQLIDDAREKGQSHAALSGLARAAALGYQRALLIPSDCPLLDPLEIDTLIANAAASGLEIGIVPDRHESGTNALLLDPSGPFQPQFGPDSLAKHKEQASRRGLEWAVKRVPSLELDVDTGEDLGELVRALGRSGARAPRTQGVLRQIERSSPRPPITA